MAERSLSVKEGKLNKRQRNLNQKQPWFGKGLKFQERFFILQSDKFVYRTKRDGSDKGSFPVRRIQVIESMDNKVFHKSFVFQVGDDDEILYLMASSEDDRMAWISAIQKVALKNGNLMLEAYHRGYFDKRWTCCGGGARESEGCVRTARYNGMDSSPIVRLVNADNIHRQAVGDRRKEMAQSMIQLDHSPPSSKDQRRSADVSLLLARDLEDSLSGAQPTPNATPDGGVKRMSATTDDSGRGSSVPPSRISVTDDGHGNQPSSDQLSSDEPSNKQPSNDQPSSDQPSSDQPSSDEPSNKQPSNDQPSSDQPSTDQPSNKQPSNDQPSSDQTSSDAPSNNQPSSDQLSSDHSQSSAHGSPVLLKRESPLLLSSSAQRRQSRLVLSAKEGPLDNGYSPLHLAIRNGNLDLVRQRLLEGGDLETPTETTPPQRPLELAFACDHHVVMEELLQQGAEPNFVLHRAAAQGSLRTMKLLIRHSASLDAKNSKGDTSLHLAARHGHAPIVELLIESGCGLQEVNNCSRSALHEAAQCGAVAVATMLVDAGMDLLLRESTFNATPYILAHKEQHSEMCKFLKRCLPDNEQPYSHMITQDSAHFGSLEFILFSNNSTLVSAGGDTQVSLWSVGAGEVTNVGVVSAGDTILGLSHHEGLVVVGAAVVQVFRVEDISTLRQMTLQVGNSSDPPLLVVGFTPQGQLAVAGTDDHSNQVLLLPKLNLEELCVQPTVTFTVGESPCCVYSLALSPCEPVAAVSVQPGTLFKAQGSKRVHLVDCSSGDTKHTIDLGKGGVHIKLNMVFSPNGQHLAVACVDEVSIWSVETGQLLNTIIPQGGPLMHCLAYSPTSPHLAIGCGGGKLKVYSTTQCSMLFELHDQQDDLTAVAFSPDGSLLAAGCKDGTMALWRTSA